MLDEDLDALAAALKALSDPTRLAILTLLLRHGELCVCDIERVLRVTQSKSSRHLRYLLNAGVVRATRHGVWMHYRVPKPRELAPAATSVLAALRPVLARTRTPELDRRFAAWRRAKSRSGPACPPAARPRGVRP
jgi:ArsR family transcriptional regulator